MKYEDIINIDWALKAWEKIWSRGSVEFKKRLNKHPNPKIYVEHDGDFTIVAIKSKLHKGKGFNYSIGVAKRNPIDPVRDEVGQIIALKRAMLKI